MMVEKLPAVLRTPKSESYLFAFLISCIVFTHLWFLGMAGCLACCGFHDFHSLFLLFLNLLRRRYDIYLSTYSKTQADTNSCAVWPILCYL